MNNKCSVDGTIIKVIKLWWIKINTKAFRTSFSDGATFPYLIKIEYCINGVIYNKNKLVYWKNDIINIGDKVIVTYNNKRPSRILKLSKKI